MTIDRGRGRFVANLLSFARIPLAALLWVAPHSAVWTLSIIALAGVSDVLDGWFARRASRGRWERYRDPAAFAASATRGAMIDGTADKIFVTSALVLLWWTQQPPIWLLLVLATRELLFIPMMLAYRFAPDVLRSRVDFSAGSIGKAATLAQFLALVLGLVGSPLFFTTAVLAGGLGLSAALTYTVRAFAVSRQRPADFASR